MDTNEKVGERIEKARRDRKLTREQLAEYADISVTFLSDIEKGRKSMTVKTLRNIAAALNVTTDYIVNGTEFYTENTMLNQMLCALTPKQRKYAEEILFLVIKAMNNNRNKIPPIDKFDK